MAQDQDAIQQLLDRWTNDPEFRATYQADPEKAIRSAGFDLSDEDWQAVRATNFDLADGKLAERINKPRIRF